MTPSSTPGKHEKAGDVFSFEIAAREAGGFHILKDGRKMLLPTGYVFWTPSLAYVNFAKDTLAAGGPEHFKGDRCLLCHECTLFIQFSEGFVAPRSRAFREFGPKFGFAATYDPIHALCAGPEAADQVGRLAPFRQFCADRGVKPPNWSQGFYDEPGEVKDLASALHARCYGEVDPGTTDYFHMLEREYQALSLAQRSVVFAYFKSAGAFCGTPAVLPMLLAKGLCTPQEFAEGYLATLCIIPGVFGDVSQAQYRREVKKVRRDAERALFFVKHH